MSDYLARMDRNGLETRVRDLERGLEEVRQRLLEVNALDEISDDLGDARAGSLGGWNADETTLTSANGAIELDAENERARIGSSNPILIDGLNGLIESDNYAAGLAGFLMNTLGNAEFNNVKVRGMIQAAVFAMNEMRAESGTLVVSKAAGLLNADFTSASGANTIQITDQPSSPGTYLFETGDVLRIKTAGGDNWFTVTARSLGSGYQQYTATLSSGTAGTAFKKDCAVIDYGQSGDGVVMTSADSATGSPNMTVAAHAGSPWSAMTVKARIGNLNGVVGISSDVYGLAIGDTTDGVVVSSEPVTFTGGTGNVVVFKGGTAECWMSADTGGFGFAAGNGKIDHSGILMQGINFFLRQMYSDAASAYAGTVGIGTDGGTPIWSFEWGVTSTNLQANPGFESGSFTSGWNGTTVGTWTVDTADKKTGTYSAKVAGAGSKLSAAIAVTAGNSYLASAWCKGSRMFIYVYWYASDGTTVVGTSVIASNVTADWNQRSGTFSAPTGAVTARFYIGTYAGSTGAWFDDTFFGAAPSTSKLYFKGTAAYLTTGLNVTGDVAVTGSISATVDVSATGDVKASSGVSAGTYTTPATGEVTGSLGASFGTHNTPATGEMNASKGLVLGTYHSLGQAGDINADGGTANADITKGLIRYTKALGARVIRTTQQSILATTWTLLSWNGCSDTYNHGSASIDETVSTIHVPGTTPEYLICPSGGAGFYTAGGGCEVEQVASATNGIIRVCLYNSSAVLLAVLAQSRYYIAANYNWMLAISTGMFWMHEGDRVTVEVYFSGAKTTVACSWSNHMSNHGFLHRIA